MSWTRALTIALLGLFGLSGCIDVETLVRIRADGTGTVEERLLMRPEVASLFKQAGQGQEGAGEAPASLLPDQESLDRRAEAMGGGASLLSAQALSSEQGEGYRLVYAFDDINTLRVNQNPGGKTPKAGQGAQVPEAGKRAEPVSFELRQGPTPELIIRAPDLRASAGQSAPSSSENESDPRSDQATGPEAELAKAMLAKLLDGLRVALVVQVQGEILRTNASHVSGSRITMAEMDFSKVLEDPRRLEAFAAADPDSLQDAKRLMRDIPGIKVELSREVRVVFAPGPAQPATAPSTRGAGARLISPGGAGEPGAAPGVYRWREVDAQAMTEHLNALVRVTREDASRVEGRLISVDGQAVVVGLAAMDGGGEVSIPRTSISAVQVFGRGP